MKDYFGFDESIERLERERLSYNTAYEQTILLLLELKRSGVTALPRNDAPSFARAVWLKDREAFVIMWDDEEGWTYHEGPADRGTGVMTPAPLSEIITYLKQFLAKRRGGKS